MSLSTLNASRSRQIVQQYKLNTGDMLKISRLGHNHWAVFIGVVTAEDNVTECFGGEPMAVHISSEDPSGGYINPGILLCQDGNRKIRPRFVRLHELLGTSNWSVDTSWDEQGITRFSPKKVKSRAEQAVEEVETYLIDLAQTDADGKKKCRKIQLKENGGIRLAPGRYHFYWSNCEHFARWCVYGFSDSSQARIALSIGVGTAAGGVAIWYLSPAIRGSASAAAANTAAATTTTGTVAAFASSLIPPIIIGAVTGVAFGFATHYLSEKHAESKRKEMAMKTLKKRKAMVKDWAEKTAEKTSAAAAADCGIVVITALELITAGINDPGEWVEKAIALSEMMNLNNLRERLTSNNAIQEQEPSLRNAVALNDHQEQEPIGALIDGPPPHPPPSAPPAETAQPSYWTVLLFISLAICIILAIYCRWLF